MSTVEFFIFRHLWKRQ